MVNHNTRSVSPQSIPRSESLQSSLKRGLRSAFGNIIDKFRWKLNENHDSGAKNNATFETEVAINDELQNNFTSVKKRRLSYLPRDPPGNVPRSKTLGNNKGIYQTYYDSVQTLNDEKSNDLEKRVSDVYDGVSVPEDDFKDPSPGAIPTSHLGPISRNQSIVDEGQLVNFGNHDESEQSPRGELAPLVIEHEFAPMYRDSEGNIARPAFINIDPRERYHLIQLKKSIEASEALQRRLKYMVDPKETISRALDATKVETATQTQDSSFLENALTMKNNKKRAISTLAQRASKKRRTVNSHGFFSGDFLYDVDTKVPGKAESLNGYLGSLSKVSSKILAPEVKPTKTTEDYDPPYKKFATDFAGTTDRRVGLDKSFKSGEKINVKLDSEYLEKAGKLAKILNIQDATKTSGKKPTAFPSSGFKFSIDNEEVTSAMHNLEKTEESGPISISETVTAPSNAKEASANGSLHFKVDDKDSVREKPSTGLFSTANKAAHSERISAASETNGKVQSSVTPVPTFSFGSKGGESSTLAEPRAKRTRESEETTESNANGLTNGKKDTETEKPKPLFSFGSKSSSSDQGTGSSSVPTFSFGKPTASPSPSVIPDNKKEGAMSSTFNTGATPSFSFGAAKEAPKDNEKKDSEESKKATPAFTFGGQKNDDLATKSETSTPLSSDQSKRNLGFSFGNKTSSSNLFGSNSTAPAKPSFNFGQTTEPALVFGAAKDDKKETTPFTFGAPAAAAKPVDGDKQSNPTKPLFSFGANNGSNSSSGQSPAPSSTTSFTFGGNKDNNTSKPFTFGSTTPATGFAASRTLSPSFPTQSGAPAPQAAPAFGGGFTFGQTGPHTPGPSAAAPALAGAGGGPAVGAGATPAPAFSFSFGSREPTPDPASIFGASGNTRELTPAAPLGFAAQNQNPNTSFTPPPLSGNPMVRNRKIAQMRLRRR